MTAAALRSLLQAEIRAARATGDPVQEARARRQLCAATAANLLRRRALPPGSRKAV